MRILILFFALLFSQISFAELTSEQQNRAKSLYNELRCVVCQNQSIAESNAEIAKDLRLLVGEKIKSGASDSEIKEFLRIRYGEFILLKPRLTKATFILWFFPIFVLLFATIFLIYIFKKQQNKI